MIKSARVGKMVASIAAALVAASPTLAAEVQGPRVVMCWGYNNYGQCNVPADLGTAVAVAGGFHYTIALRSARRVDFPPSDCPLGLINP